MSGFVQRGAQIGTYEQEQVNLNRVQKRGKPLENSASTYSPTAFRRSTFGDGGLNCRVRNGTGCTPSSINTELTRGFPSGAP